MIDISDFVSKWQGTYVEAAGTSAPNQCVDIVNRYIADVLHLPMIEWTNAKDFPSKAGDQYEWIANSPTNVPEEGDLIVWDGLWGHIAIFLNGNVNDFHSFDQNYPTGTPCHIQYHNYTNVKGWLRYKGQVSSADQCDPNWRIERDTNWNLHLADQEEIKKLQAQLALVTSQVPTLKKTIIDFINAQ